MGLIKTIRVLRMFRSMAGRLPLKHLWFLYRQMRYEKPHVFDGQIRINTFFPPYPSPQFKRFCEHVVARRRVPYSAYVALTGECPDSCDHCSYGHRDNGMMSTTQWLDIISQLSDLGTCTIGFTGGEPLLRDDLVQLVEAASRTMSTIMFTTGSGLNEDMAQQLAGKITCVTVGIESDNSIEHDRIRKREGSFAAASSAIAACRKAGIYTAVSTVAFAGRVNDNTLERIYQLAKDWDVGEFRILSPIATGSASGNDQLRLDESNLQKVRDFHRKYNRQTSGPAIASFARLESQELFGCGGGYHHLFIDSSGQMCPCDLTPISFGDLTSETVANIWERMGEYFSQPRCRCIMKDLEEQLGSCTLPLPPEVSENICTRAKQGDPLPGCYSRILK